MSRNLSIFEVGVFYSRPRAEKPIQELTVEGYQQIFRNFIDLKIASEKLRQHNVSPPNKSINEINLFCSRNSRPHQLGWLILQDAVVYTYTTENSLSNSSHRFMVPSEDYIAGARYHSESFNVDAQCIPARPLNLEGFEIGKNERSRTQLAIVASLATAASLRPPNEIIIDRRHSVAHC